MTGARHAWCLLGPGAALFLLACVAAQVLDQAPLGDTFFLVVWCAVPSGVLVGAGLARARDPR